MREGWPRLSDALFLAAFLLFAAGAGAGYALRAALHTAAPPARAALPVSTPAIAAPKPALDPALSRAEAEAAQLRAALAAARIQADSWEIKSRAEENLLADARAQQDQQDARVNAVREAVEMACAARVRQIELQVKLLPASGPLGLLIESLEKSSQGEAPQP